jgi:hypothetical protein
LPDNPVLYPTLGLHNPFPVDWMIPAEIAGSEARVLAVADALRAEGDYLILFQPIAADRLNTVPSLAQVSGGPFRDDDFGRELRRRVSGISVSCGAFDGVWAP